MMPIRHEQGSCPELLPGLRQVYELYQESGFALARDDPEFPLVRKALPASNGSPEAVADAWARLLSVDREKRVLPMDPHFTAAT